MVYSSFCRLVTPESKAKIYLFTSSNLPLQVLPPLLRRLSDYWWRIQPKRTTALLWPLVRSSHHNHSVNKKIISFASISYLEHLDRECLLGTKDTAHKMIIQSLTCDLRTFYFPHAVLCHLVDAWATTSYGTVPVSDFPPNQRKRGIRLRNIFKQDLK